MIRFRVSSVMLLALMVVPVFGQRTILVDDDGAQCPGAVATIREAVSRAAAGTTILVCPGTYRGEVEIRGQNRNGIKLIAVGPAEGVVVGPQNAAEAAGFTLMDVSGVLIRGFTVSGFRSAESTAAQFGAGSSIRLLEDANENTIEHNRMTNTGMFGVRIINGYGNVVQNNTIYSIDAFGFGCGIMFSGPKANNNTIRHNLISDTPGAGIMARDGSGNVIVGNTLLNNGRYGIDVQGTSNTLVQANRATGGPGYWGSSPAGAPGSLDSRGLNSQANDGMIANLNEFTGNAGLDIFSDGEGKNDFSYNTCGLANLNKLCTRVVSCPAGSRCSAKEAAWPPYDMM